VRHISTGLVNGAVVCKQRTFDVFQTVWQVVHHANEQYRRYHRSLWKAELEKKVAANLKAERQQADGATAKGAIETATAENDTMAAARQKAENTEYIAQLTAELTANAETMEDDEEGLISDQRSMSTSSVCTECTTSASEPDESDNDFTAVNRDRKRKRASTSSNGSAATAQVRENKVQRA